MHRGCIGDGSQVDIFNGNTLVPTPAMHRRHGKNIWKVELLPDSYDAFPASPMQARSHGVAWATGCQFLSLPRDLFLQCFYFCFIFLVQVKSHKNFGRAQPWP